MKRYLYAIQTPDGREVVSVELDVDRVSDVRANIDVRHDDTFVTIDHLGDAMTPGTKVDPDQPLVLYRWPADDKLGVPVAHPVKPESIEES